MPEWVCKQGVRTPFHVTVAVLLGCQTPTVTRVSTGKPAPSPPPAAVQATRSAAPVSPGVVNRATLFGTLQAPASLVSNNGGALISNNGGGLISNNGGGLISNNGGGLTGRGGGYRLLALEQVPLRNATVEILDAAGKPVLDANGQALKVTTNDRGEYALFTDVPAKNLVLKAVLPENKGTVQALAARDSRAEAVQMDLISTLTTAYILERFVASQTDQQQTLDKLPGKVEKDTRALAEIAFTSSNATVPPVLDTNATITAVDSLRKANGGFDEQMEKVKRLLIAAGQSGLGEGRLATTVGFNDVRQVFDAPDGSTYIHDGRLWRVRPDGILETALGGGNLEPDKADGKSAKEVNNELEDFSLDGAGRIVGRYFDGIVRVENDGTLKVLASRLPGRIHALVPGNGETIWYIGQASRGKRNDTGLYLYELQPGKEPQSRGTLDIPSRNSGITMGFDPEGVLVVNVDQWQTSATYRINPTNAAMTPVETSAWSRIAVDHKGRLSVSTEEGRLGVIAVDADEPIWFDVPTDNPRISIGHDGQSLLVMSDGIISRLTGLEKTVIAGMASNAGVGGQASDLALFDTTAITVDADGSLYLYDRTRRKLVRIDKNQVATEVPFSRANNDLNFGESIYAMRINDAGEIIAAWGLLSPSLLKIQPDGRHEEHFKEPVKVIDYVVRPGGELIVLTNEHNGPSRISRWRPGGPLIPLYSGQIETHSVDNGRNPPITYVTRKPDWGNRSLLLGAEDTYWIFGGSELLKWKPGSDPQLVKKDYNFNRFEDDNEGSLRDAITMGPGGVLYFAGTYGMGDGSANRIGSYDPVKDELRIIAGQGGVIFNGTGVDDSLQDPYNPIFEPSGALLFIDNGARQVKRIPKDKLVGNVVTSSTDEDE